MIERPFLIRECVATGGKEFARLDYNNQRNFMWYCVDVARAIEEKKEYDMRNFPYMPPKYQELLLLAKVLSQKSSKEVTQIAVRLTQLNRKSTIRELFAA
ncbi:hypothetical protein FJZ19_01980 [Candidatus Pacearchaeota archaeon]|nr:hypothetical protein [Candidatus Pacearchaeota archaeon]